MMLVDYCDKMIESSIAEKHSAVSIVGKSYHKGRQFAYQDIKERLKPQPPTPVAWANLKDGETYWRVRNGNSRCAPLCVSITINMACRQDEYQQIKWEREYIDSQGRPMIYTTPADAVDTMKACLDQWLEGVGNE